MRTSKNKRNGFLWLAGSVAFLLLALLLASALVIRFPTLVSAAPEAQLGGPEDNVEPMVAPDKELPPERRQPPELPAGQPEQIGGPPSWYMDVMSNPLWDIYLDSAGYSDQLWYTHHDLTHEMLSGEWGAAIRYDELPTEIITDGVNAGLPQSMWLTDYMICPDWGTNSTFTTVVPITTWDDPANPVVGNDTGYSVIENGQVTIRIDYQMLDKRVAMGKAPALPNAVLSERYVLKQTYYITNTSEMPLTDVEFFQFIHPHPGDSYGPDVEIVYDPTFYPVGDFQNYHYDVTAWTFNVYMGQLEHVSFASAVEPDNVDPLNPAWPFGVSHFRSDVCGGGKPPTGLHVDVENDNMAGPGPNVIYGPDQVAGAEKFVLTPVLEPGGVITAEVILSIGGFSDFFWKAGDWEDYALSGIPDFDQKQDGWFDPETGQWSFCGPVAAANSLWWFDSKFEPSPVPPPYVNDGYPLVESYAPGELDDHDIGNVEPFVNDLAVWFATDPLFGTDVYSMAMGIEAYIASKGLAEDYTVTLVPHPDFDWVAAEVERSEDVILLLGFWESTGPDEWQRLGGHFVTVPGVDSTGQQIAFSDPFRDWAVEGRPGRVLPPDHPTQPYSPTLHNDTLFVSHDIYAAVPTDSPGGMWGPEGYIEYFDDVTNFLGQNFTLELEEWRGIEYLGGPIATEVEYAIAVSPVPLFFWKAGDWEDYALSGIPDFDQKQDGWFDPETGQWSFCGPVAAANSLWWFDSKFEPNPIPPPYVNDGYPLVEAYGEWDDHDPGNVEPFVGDLAGWFGTDPMFGTDVYSMAVGIEDYIASKGLAEDYVVTLVPYPDFEWIAEEVERSEDVILLLGFWESTGPDEWQRLGGHFVTVPGVDSTGQQIAFSDPFRDWAVEGRPGRVLPPDHPTQPYSPTLHNDTLFVSHDIYAAVPTDSPGGIWGPEGYVEYFDDITNFLGQNFTLELEEWRGIEYLGGPIVTEVEYAIAVSPVIIKPVISEIRTTNVRDTSFTVSWLTDADVSGQVNYGTDPANLNQTAYDDRGVGTSDDTHYVTLQGLSPNTTYYFDVVSRSSTDDNGGAHYSLTTGPTLGLPGSDTIYGQVFKSDGTTPAEGAIVYITLRDADGSGSPGEAAPLSALVDDTGYWYTNLGNARLADLSAYFTYSASGDQVRLEAQGAADGVGCQRVDTADDTPAADIVLNVSPCTSLWPIEIWPGWNHISLPLDPVTSYTAEGVCIEINSQGGDAVEIDRWYASGWDSHVCGLPFNNYTLTLGSDYFIKSNAVSTWTIEGWEVTTGVPLDLQIGWNSIGVPHTDAYTAESLCTEIISQGVTAIEIDRWYAGGWDGHICGLPFNDFDIEIGTGYFVKADSAGTVTPTMVMASRSREPEAALAALPEAVPATAVAVRDLQVSNLRDTAVTLSWIADEPATGYVLFGETPALGRVTYDVRGPGVAGDTHYVVLTGLAPETAYYFDIVSGAGVDDNGDAHYTVTTMPTLDTLPDSDTVYGQVFRADGVTLAAGTIVYLTLMDDDGAGSAGQAMLVSALVDADGYWHSNLGNARLADGSDTFAYSTTGDAVTLVAQGAGVGFITQTVDTGDLRPAAPLIPVRQFQLYLPLVIRE